MSDSLNALLAPRGDFAHPAQLNVLGAYEGAARAANSIYEVRSKQSDAAWGQALQAATDENGNVDYPKAQALAAKDPYATQGMLRSLLATSQLTGEQQSNIRSHMATVGHGSMSLMLDPSDTNVNAVIDGLEMSGMPRTQAENVRQQLLGMKNADGTPNLTARQQLASRYGLAAMDAVNAANRAGGEMRPEQFGGVTAPTVQTQPVPGYTGGGMIVGPATSHINPNEMVTVYDSTGKVIGVVPRGTLPMMPGTPGAAGTQSAPSTAPKAAPQGVPPPGTVPGGGRNAPPVSLQKPRPSSSASDLPPVAANTQNGVQVASADAGFAPNVGSPNAPSPAVAGDVAAMMRGVTQAQGGPPTVQQAAYVPPAAPTNTMPYTASQGAPVPVTPTQAPFGVQKQIEGDTSERFNDVKNAPLMHTQVENMKMAYDALQAITTGPTQDSVNTLRRLAVGWGLVSPSVAATTENFDIFKKSINRYILNQAQAWGGTDMARAMSRVSNPDEDVSTGANIKFLRNDIAKTLQGLAAPEGEDMSGSAEGYTQRRNNIAKTTDFRGFGWPMFTPDEQKEIVQSTLDAKGNETDATRKLYKAIGISNRLNLKPPLPFIPLTRPTQGATP